MKTNILAPLVGSLLVSTLIVGCGESEPKKGDPVSAELTQQLLDSENERIKNIKKRDIEDFKCVYLTKEKIACKYTVHDDFVHKRVGLGQFFNWNTKKNVWEQAF